MKIIPVLLLAIGCLTAQLTLADQTNSPAPATPSSSPDDALNNDGVIQLKQLGLGDSVIIEKIKTSHCAFDVSLNGLKQLKSAGISDEAIATMLAAQSTANTSGVSAAVLPSDPNDPKSPHEAGIWIYEENGGKPKMVELEPSVYSQSKSGVALFMEFGQTVKTRAIIHSAHAELVTTNRQPVFYFYFEHAESGLSDIHGATSPNEYILAQFEVAENDNERRLVMGSLNAYSGGQKGTDSKSVRSIDFQKLSPGVYKVSPKDVLANGEFGFFYGGETDGDKVFDFGVNGSPDTEPVPPVVESNGAAAKKH
jgi:hypothetical protein